MGVPAASPPTWGDAFHVGPSLGLRATDSYSDRLRLAIPTQAFPAKHEHPTRMHYQHSSGRLRLVL